MGKIFKDLKNPSFYLFSRASPQIKFIIYFAHSVINMYKKG